MPSHQIPLIPNKVYHVFNHANGNENLFNSEANYSYFLLKYAYYIEPIAETYAYCLMPNHLHLMVKIKSEEELQLANIKFRLDKDELLEAIKPIEEGGYSKFISRVFGNCFSSYAQAYNKIEKRKGCLFMPNFKRKEVITDAYFAKLIFYIHNNPVHHQFTNRMEEWNYSSYFAYLVGAKTKVNTKKIVDWFGGIYNFCNYHQTEEIDILEIEDFEFYF